MKETGIWLFKGLKRIKTRIIVIKYSRVEDK